ncbi:MAG: phospholipid carrier-dependent glycosyltransferase [Anaerolineales bacterium]
MFQRRPPATSDWAIALLLCTLLVAIYSLTFSGAFTSDDEHILASRALGLAFDGAPNDARVFGNDRLRALAALPDEQAVQALNIEPGQIVVGALLARIATALGVGRVQMLFTLNVWATAMTGGLVYLAARRLRFALPTALVCALLFGLGSQAWPYARTYFRDPLAALFLSCAWLGALGASTARGRGRRVGWTLLLAGGLAAGILTKNTAALAIPSLALAVSGDAPWRRFALRAFIRRRWPWVLTAAAAIAAWLLVFPLASSLARFTPDYYGFLLRFFVNSPHPKLLPALSGPFISPGKSIFLYSPMLILSAIALVGRGRLAWSAWLYALLLVVGQALFYDAGWHGNINWGLRFMLPALPLLAVAAAPVVDAWLGDARLRVALLAIAVAAIGVQLAGALVPARAYYVELAQLGVEAVGTLGVWSASHSALLWQLRWLTDGHLPDLASLRVGVTALPLVMALAALGLLATLAIARGWPKALSVIALLLAAGATLWLLAAMQSDPASAGNRDDLLQALQFTDSRWAGGDVAVVNAYGTPVWTVWMNRAGPGRAWYSLPLRLPPAAAISEFETTGDPSAALGADTVRLFERLADGEARRVWLVAAADAPGARWGLAPAWFTARARTVENWTFGANTEGVTLYLFVMP